MIHTPMIDINDMNGIEVSSAKMHYSPNIFTGLAISSSVVKKGLTDFYF